LEVLRGDKTVLEIAAKHQLHPNQVSTWKRQAIDGRDGPESDLQTPTHQLAASATSSLSFSAEKDGDRLPEPSLVR